MIRTQTHKLIYRATDTSELYDLVEDPRELHNRYADPALQAIRQQLSTALLDWYQRTSDVTPMIEDPRGLPPA
jgi:arylsulfatase A-like enzyme